MLDTYMHLFSYKILNNIFYFNKKQFSIFWGESTTYLWQFCIFPEENAKHVFSVCHHTEVLKNQLKIYFDDCLYIPDLSLQTVIS